MKKRRLHVIPGGPVDREWTDDFLCTRSPTVRFLDSLPSILDEVRECQFILDSQAVPLEGYLATRPEKVGALKRFVGEKRPRRRQGRAMS